MTAVGWAGLLWQGSFWHKNVPPTAVSIVSVLLAQVFYTGAVVNS